MVYFRNVQRRQCPVLARRLRWPGDLADLLVCAMLASMSRECSAPMSATRIIVSITLQVHMHIPAGAQPPSLQGALKQSRSMFDGNVGGPRPLGRGGIAQLALPAPSHSQQRHDAPLASLLLQGAGAHNPPPSGDPRKRQLPPSQAVRFRHDLWLPFCCLLEHAGCGRVLQRRAATTAFHVLQSVHAIRPTSLLCTTMRACSMVDVVRSAPANPHQVS
jgi:hypothetical protein